MQVHCCDWCRADEVVATDKEDLVARVQEITGTGFLVFTQTISSYTAALWSSAQCPDALLIDLTCQALLIARICLTSGAQQINYL